MPGVVRVSGGHLQPISGAAALRQLGEDIPPWPCCGVVANARPIYPEHQEVEDESNLFRESRFG